MKDDTPYEPDRVEGVPHPRHTERLYGHAAAERAVLDAWTGDHMHHAWLLTGPRGIGKATLAWRIARFLIAGPERGGMFGKPDNLDLPPDHPVTARTRALSEPSLYLMRPTVSPTGTERRDITVDVARGLRDFLHMSATEGGQRVVIVDSADQLNPQAANAILKLVEEPPARTTFLLVSHAPTRLLPTIRSRCRMLALQPLNAADVGAAITQAGLEPSVDATALSQLASGSVGEAARLLQEDGPKLYADLVAIAVGVPDIDRQRLLKLTAGLTGTAGRGKMDALARLLDLLLSRLARHGAGLPPDAEAAPGEADVLARLSPDPAAGRAWADLAQDVSARVAHGRAVNLDPSSLFLDSGLMLNKTGRATRRG